MGDKTLRKENGPEALTALIWRTAGGHIEAGNIARMTVLKRWRPGGYRKRRSTVSHLTREAILGPGTDVGG